VTATTMAADVSAIARPNMIAGTAGGFLNGTINTSMSTRAAHIGQRIWARRSLDAAR